MCHARLSFSVPGVLNLLVLSATTGSALGCYFTCMFRDPGRQVAVKSTASPCKQLGLCPIDQAACQVVTRPAGFTTDMDSPAELSASAATRRRGISDCCPGLSTVQIP